MNNKGFTLIELLAVILILSSISIVAVVSITNSLEKRDTKECQELEKLAINAGKIYFSLNGGTTVSIATLKDKGYFNETQKAYKHELTGNVVLKNDKYEFSGTCKPSS
ncbi:MAG: prepilin-type N-terminal cleavage/methylation domain-containing protein [Bacilli bacterium]|nr:prepilin-type N-terminal cleavage/methylation domain-containing protein [Bacilli bacterium]